MQNEEKTNEQLTNQLVELMRERIMETNSRVVVVDVTSMPSIDTKTAQHIIDIIREAQLLGAYLVLTGVRPTITRSLAHLGVDLSDLLTRWSLVAGLWAALDIMELPAVNKTNRRWNDRKRNWDKLPV